MEPNSNDLSRRSFVKAAGYVAPVILTLKARPAHASLGSGAFGTDARLRRDLNRVVGDLRRAEKQGRMSDENRANLQRTAQEWQAAGTDKYVRDAIDRKIDALKRSGKKSQAKKLKTELDHLIALARKFLG